MSNALQTLALVTAITTAIQTAARTFLNTEAENPIVVYRGQPLTQVTIPCAIIDVPGVEISLSGFAASVANPSQENSFKIIIRQPFPSDETLILNAKIATANAVIAQLQTSATFAGIAGRPLVTHVDLGREKDNYSTRVYEVELDFSCFTIASHH